MGTTIRIALTAIMTTLLLALAVSSAAALRSIQSSERTIAALSRALSFTSEVGTVICEVGLSLTLNEPRIAKRPGGSIARVLFRVLNPREECTGGRVRFLSEAGPFLVTITALTVPYRK